jgi:hypothetical protein
MRLPGVEVNSAIGNGPGGRAARKKVYGWRLSHAVSGMCESAPNRGLGLCGDQSGLTNRSVEDAPQIIDSTTPVARVFITFGGPQAHGNSLTVAALLIKTEPRQGVWSGISGIL